MIPHSCRACGKSEPEVGFYREVRTARIKPLCKRCWYLKTQDEKRKRRAREAAELSAAIVTNGAAARFLRLPLGRTHE